MIKLRHIIIECNGLCDYFVLVQPVVHDKEKSCRFLLIGADDIKWWYSYPVCAASDGLKTKSVVTVYMLQPQSLERLLSAPLVRSDSQVRRCQAAIAESCRARNHKLAGVSS